MSGTMRAAVLVGPERFEVREVPRPEVHTGQVRIQLEGSGVCSSNLPPWEGRPWFRYPMQPGQPGHEGWGVVEAVGAGVKGLEEGDRVAAISGAAFAEYESVDAGSVVKLPASLAGQPFPGEPLGCAVNVWRRSDIREGQVVAIVGVGFLGAILTRLAVTEGARVLAVTRRASAQRLAKELGAEWIFPPGDREAVLDAASEHTGGRLCDRVVECVGLQAPLDLAGALTRERGRLVIAGYHQDGRREVDLQLWNWRGLDVINAHERDPLVYAEGIRMAADWVVSGRLNPAPLYTHRVPLEQVGRAFAALHERPEGLLKALVEVRR